MPICEKYRGVTLNYFATPIHFKCVTNFLSYILLLLPRIIDVLRHVASEFWRNFHGVRAREEGDFIYADNAGCIAVG